ncbi:hypothetical protein AGRA3207_002129 [Actinomadura graeca]|uniref:NACHT domain-containing protein n=1 Tax=Actinomadura graeca TaxID=2750812 RepID=A0ABX8QR65_9ACTN|nr:hypothetical protein [Actinomadura graeca]QXJ21291.1 hypothetical protein AGRA3207_002129 [Actinomadura graeca]
MTRREGEVTQHGTAYGFARIFQVAGDMVVHEGGGPARGAPGERVRRRWTVLACGFVLVAALLPFAPLPAWPRYGTAAALALAAGLGRWEIARRARTRLLGDLLSVVAPGGRPPAATDVNPYRIGVSRSRYAGDGPRLGYVPERDTYIPRHPFDADLDAAITGARDHIVLVVGGAKAGKSRTAWEAVRRLPRAAVLVPRPGRLASLRRCGRLRARRRGPLVLWLDDLGLYLTGDERLTDALLLWLRRRHPGLVVVATMTSRAYWDVLDPDPAAPAADTLKVVEEATVLSLSPGLTPGELEQARRLYPDEVFQRGPGEELVAAWAHDELYELGPDDPARWAVIRAAIDWRRAGIGRPVPGRALARIVPHYLAAERGTDRFPAAARLEEGLAWALTVPKDSPAKALEQVEEEPEPSYTAFDYLVERADRTGSAGRGPLPIPAAAWAEIVAHAAPEDVPAVIRSARRRGAGEAVLSAALERLRALRPGDTAPERLPGGLEERLHDYLGRLAGHPDLPEPEHVPLELPVRRRTDLDVRLGLEPPAGVRPPERLGAIAAIREARRCVLLGDPGSGKTTTLRILLDAFAAESSASGHIPVYVWLPRGGGTGGTASERVERLIGDAFRRTHPGITDADVRALLDRGRLALLFDGLNEIGAAHAGAFLDGLAEVLDGHDEHIVIIATRTHGFESRFADRPFGVLQLLELDYPDGVRAFVAARLAPGDADGMMAALDARAPLRRLALNPLLLHLMVTAYGTAGRLPGSRARLLDTIVRELLDDPAQHALLARLGYEMRLKGLELTTGQAEETCGAALGGLVRTPLLLRDADTGRVRFWHQTFQEYFAASHVSGDLRRYLRRHGRDPAWREVLALAAGLLPEDDAYRCVVRMWRRDRLLAVTGLSSIERYDGPRWDRLRQRFAVRLRRRITVIVGWQRGYPYVLTACYGSALWLVPGSVIDSLPGGVLTVVPIGLIALVAFFRLYASVLLRFEKVTVRRHIRPGITALRMLDDVGATRLLTELKAAIADDFTVGKLTRAALANQLLPRSRTLRELELRLASPETRLEAVEHLGDLASPAAMGMLRDLLDGPDLDDLTHAAVIRELLRYARTTGEPTGDLEQRLREQAGGAGSYVRRRRAYRALRDLGADAAPPSRWGDPRLAALLAVLAVVSGLYWYWTGVR